MNSLMEGAPFSESDLAAVIQGIGLILEGLQNYLKANGIPYLFTCADNSIFHNHTVNSPDSVITSLLNQINLKNFDFIDRVIISPRKTIHVRNLCEEPLKKKGLISKFRDSDIKISPSQPT